MPLRTMSMMLLAAPLTMLCACQGSLRPGDETVTWTEGEKEAIAIARATLSEHTGISAQLIALSGVETRQWPDAGMGCGSPSQAHAQVLTDGHAVTLKAGGRGYEVHVAGRSAVVCETPEP